MNTVIQWTEEGIWYEPDPRHAELILRDLGLDQGSQAKVVPGEKDEVGPEEEEELDEAGATLYRAVVARSIYLAQDRSDVQFAVKELSRWMSRPTVTSMQALKRFGRYLVDKPRVRTLFGYQGVVHCLDTYVDTDYAGCRRTRKSTSGGLVRLGEHTIKTWSLTQSVVTLSSGEAEFYGLVRGASVTLGTKGLMSDLGVQLQVHIHSDASAAIGIAQRRGVGKVRHIEVHQLWVQDRVGRGDIAVHKVHGEKNPADALTKYVNGGKLREHMEQVELRVTLGRHRLAPKLA